MVANILNIFSNLKNDKIFNMVSNNVNLQPIYFLDLLNYYLNNIYKIKEAGSEIKDLQTLKTSIIEIFIAFFNNYSLEDKIIILTQDRGLLNKILDLLALIIPKYFSS